MDEILKFNRNGGGGLQGERGLGGWGGGAVGETVYMNVTKQISELRVLHPWATSGVNL